METVKVIGIVGAIFLIAIMVYFVGKFVVRMYAKRVHKGYLKFYDETQRVTIKTPNAVLNKCLLEFSDEPTEELYAKILDILTQNNTYVILTYFDNKDPNDNKLFIPTNSINFRKIKEGNIGVFTDFEIMEQYVGNYISTDIMLIGDFIELCANYGGITSITLNFTLPHHPVLTLKTKE